MQEFEYRVIPAPRRGEKAKGAKTVAERFGVALANAMNDLARDGWEYLRADTLPCEERVGLTGSATHFQHMLVFRRTLAQPAARPVATAHPAPVMADLSDLLPEPAPAAPEPVATPAEESTVLSPFSPDPGRSPPLGPATALASHPAANPASPVVPFPNGRG